MKKLSILLAAVILAVSVLISGCGSSSVADEFVGTWGSDNGYTYISIEKKGEKTFIVNEYFFDKKNKTDLYESNLGELKEKVLDVNYNTYTIDNHKMISGKNTVYTKLKEKASSKEELQELAKSK